VDPSPILPERPCAPYVTASERIEIPFPGKTIDRKDVRLLDQGTPVPARGAGASSPQGYAYNLDSQQISLVYHGLGQDTTRRAFKATVSRSFSSPDEERLIRIAEETYRVPGAEGVAGMVAG